MSMRDITFCFFLPEFENIGRIKSESLREIAENLKDSSLYAYLKQTQPIGENDYLDEKKQAAFEKEMGLWKSDIQKAFRKNTGSSQGKCKNPLQTLLGKSKKLLP